MAIGWRPTCSAVAGAGRARAAGFRLSTFRLRGAFHHGRGSRLRWIAVTADVPGAVAAATVVVVVAEN